MAFEFDADAVFRSACSFLAKGIRPVVLHGINDKGFCTCGKPEHHVDAGGKKQCGKHPREAGWQFSAAKTEDDAAAWLEIGLPFNMGVQLGPKSGIIDIEWDDEKAKRAAEELGLTSIETPTYSSGRSEHRLFAWDDRFSQCVKAVVYPRGLEVRLGIGTKGSQSVAPPSWHWSGVQYKWKPTLAIDDVDVAKLPEDIIRMIVTVNASGATSENRGKAKSSRWAIHGPMSEGHRHPTLLSLATKLVMRSPCIDEDEEQADILGLVWNTNLQNCKPPKTRDEVAQIIHSCLNWRRQIEESNKRLPQTSEELAKAAEEIEKAAGEKVVEPPVTGYAVMGLEYVTRPGSSEGEWMPGTWSIQMVNSDPAEIVLSVPGWKDTPCKGRVALTLDEYRSAKLVASKVFSATRRVILDGDRGEWERVWRGQEGNTKRPSIQGLMQKLMIDKDKAKDIDVGTSSLRFATLAGYLMETFAKATKPRDEDKPEPNQSGRPCWVKPDELWFRWAKTWEDIGRMHDVQSGERIRIRHMLCQAMGVEDLPESRHTFGDTRFAYIVFTPAWIEALKGLADGGVVSE